MPEGKAVQSMFAGIAGRYDRANHVLSGGIDWYWRRRLVNAVLRARPGHVVDLATGSGDVALSMRKRLPEHCIITGLDFCEPMLEEARLKQAARGFADANLSFGFGDCLNLPLPDASADVITIAFGLRNLEDRDRGLREMLRILRPGGTLLVLEFTQPNAWFRPFYHAYLRHVLPQLASWLTGDRSAYDYLVGSIHAFPTKESLAAEIRAAGFASVRATGLTGSSVALHQATAPMP